jgi:hypothetical protein
MEIEQQLRWALMSGEPGKAAEDAVMARVSAAAWRASQTGRRRRSPLIITGLVLIVAAAAAMLAAYLSASKPLATTSVGIPQNKFVVASPETPSESTDVADPAPAISISPPVPAYHATVLLQPLQVQSADPELQAAAREFYDAFIEGLRISPRIVLLQPAPTGAKSETRADFRLSFTAVSGGITLAQTDKGLALGASRTPHPAGKWQIGIQLEALRQQQPRASPSAGGEATSTPRKFPAGALRFAITGGDLGCPGYSNDASGRCPSPSSLASMIVESMHLQMLPKDPELLRALQLRLMNAEQPYGRRFEALDLLARWAADDMDAQTMSAALDFIASSPAGARIRLLQALRGRVQPELLQGLIDLANRDPDTSVRTEALSMLIANYRTDPAAFATVESLAAGELLPLVRHVAERAISGDEAWNNYVVTTAKDESLPPAQRFAPLAYLIQMDQRSDARKLLDDTVIAALVQVLPPLMNKSDPNMPAVALLGLLPATGSPAVIDLILASMQKAQDPAVKLLIADVLARYRDNPRVREELADIVAGDADAQLRSKAAYILDPSAQSPAR